MDKILEKNLLFHSSGDSSRVTIGTGGAFSMWPNITPQKPLRCWVIMGNWPNLTLVTAKLYPKLWDNGELLNFVIFVGGNYC